LTTPLLKTTQFRIVFAACWLCWIVLHEFVLNRFGLDWNSIIWDSAVSNVLLAATALLVAVVLQFYIPQKNKYGYILGLCSVLAAIWLFLSRTILLIALKEASGYESFFSLSMPIRFVIGLLITGCMALISVLWYTVQDQREIEQRKTEAEKLSKDAELYKLRQQLQPHFLFNSLNSINALIGLRPQQARTMIQQLSDFLRGTLKKEDNQWISLQEELQHLQLYLEIEKVRFGHRLTTVVNNETDGRQLKLPALLLQPILENAIKFGLYDTTGDITITVEARSEDNTLIVQVKNPFDPETSAPKKGTGFGLSSVQRRLYLLFARNDLLQTQIQEQLFITTIKIPQQK
jgi:two-component system LytT family sensor kinase